MTSAPLTLRAAQPALRLSLWAGVIALVLAFAPQQAMAGDAAAEGFIKKVAGSIISTMASSQSQAQKQAKFGSIFARNADVPAIGIFALGKYARKLPSGKRSEYFKLMRDFISSVFSKRMNDINGNAVEITGSDVRGKEVIVSSTLKFASGRSPLSIKWRVVKRSGGYKIFDVNVSGIWLAPEQRSVFVSIISKNDGNVNALLDHLRKSS